MEDFYVFELNSNDSKVAILEKCLGDVDLADKIFKSVCNSNVEWAPIFKCEEGEFKSTFYLIDVNRPVRLETMSRLHLGKETVFTENLPTKLQPAVEVPISATQCFLVILRLKFLFTIGASRYLPANVLVSIMIVCHFPTYISATKN